MPRPVITPWVGAPGYLCCITAESYRRMLADPPEGSVYMQCPGCGAPMYVTPEAQGLLFENPQLRAVCTACAFRLGARAGGQA